MLYIFIQPFPCNTISRNCDMLVRKSNLMLVGSKKVFVSLSIYDNFSLDCGLQVAVKNKENNQNGELACQMLMAGLLPKNEPFLQKILWDMVKGRLHEYAKGKVPVSKSMYLMGCSDPSGLLQRNQVAIIL